jgi:hypothetical protein
MAAVESQLHHAVQNTILAKAFLAKDDIAVIAFAFGRVVEIIPLVNNVKLICQTV